MWTYIPDNMKIWMVVGAFGFIGFKALSHRKHFKAWLFKYSCVGLFGAVLAYPFHTMYNVKHIDQTLAYGVEMSYKMGKAKRGLKKTSKSLNKKIGQVTPKVISQPVKWMGKKYDQLGGRATHRQAARSLNSGLGTSMYVPSPSIPQRVVGVAKTAIKLISFGRIG